MKKTLAILLAIVAVLTVFSGCSKTEAPSSTAPEGEVKVIKIGASPTPHAEILKEAAKILEAQNIKLDIVEYSDYVQPNLALGSNDLNANFFQHQPYLDSFNADNNLNLVSVAAVHYEPLGIYAGKTASLADIPEKAVIGIPNDESNGARALLLLESVGIIELDPNAGILATKLDIVSNPKNVEIVELNAEQVSISLQDLDLGVINGNFAILAGLDVNSALAKEEADSLAAETYANVLVINGDVGSTPEIEALVEALKSEDVKTYIANSYNGAVVAK